MQRVTLHHLDVAAVQGLVGAEACTEGIHAARQHAVVRVEWDPKGMLVGTVHDRFGAFHEVTAHFATGWHTSALVLEGSECDCALGGGCAHVAALVFSTVLTTATTPDLATPAANPRPAAWERDLGMLLGPGPSADDGATPLAIELTLSVPTGTTKPMVAARGMAARAPTLSARPVRPGRNGWVGGGLSWTRLSSLRHTGEYPRAQLRLLQELYAVYQAHNDGARYSAYNHYHEVKVIDLAAFHSRQLWPLLDQAEHVGVRLVHNRVRLGPVERYATAAVCLDVTSAGPAGPLMITPVVRVGGAPVAVEPALFLGTDGHGLVYLDAEHAEPGHRPIRLAELDRPVSAPLREQLLRHQVLEVPATERSRFGEEFYPRLRHRAEMISSDGSFTPPVISEPTLVLHADYGTDHDLRISWEWAYRIDDSTVHVPLEPSGQDDGYRDPAAERALLRDLDVPFGRFSLAGTDPTQLPAEVPRPAPNAELTGIDTLRVTTELLPLLADRPGVAVRITGTPADYREVTDSLRIGLSTTEIPGETDWFDLGVSISVTGQQVPFADLLVALGTDQPYLLLRDGTYFSLLKPELGALRRLIEEASGLPDTPPGTLRISRFQAGFWDELTRLGVVDHQAAAWRQQVEGLLTLESMEALRAPATLRAQLRPYQLDGFRWLAFLWEFRLGGILADDMGLGKTLQTLALFCHAKQLDPSMPPFLIVAPTSVVSNWAAESARFTPGLKVVTISDTLRRRGRTLVDVIADADVVITSYTLFRLDVDAHAGQAWSGLVLDEAQFTKNHQSKVHHCARKVGAPFKLAITGTPMENNLMELWSLLSITAPGLFPTPTRFRDRYARPIEKQGDTELLAQLRNRVRPLIKRRTKEQVVTELPPKQEQILEVELHPRHRKIYHTHLQRERQKILGLIDDLHRNRFTILRSLTLLRQLSLHAGLVDEQYRDLPSSKIDALLGQLEDVVAGGHRALVFSQFTGFLTLVRARLDDAGTAYCYLDGSTRDRAEVLRRFSDGAAPVFLISLKAGGFGLNLTEADYCFLLDPWWNPATEAQAVDRAHRIGQARTVMVYRLIARDTIEEKVMAMKARKSALFSSVMDEGNLFDTSLNADDIRALLT